ncbi:apoptosis-inducing factor 3-like protein [Elysia marginata]|uniref:Apoptosis-inducing factor 3-like protein n=1 Tax=Elysia marginata TaxID=1093978 RepID=A0AAV4GQZ5_9GAST|nr:apoptosis-inducing factor 3-like protein [Elysia marginata]
MANRVVLAANNFTVFFSRRLQHCGCLQTATNTVTYTLLRPAFHAEAGGKTQTFSWSLEGNAKVSSNLRSFDSTSVNFRPENQSFFSISSRQQNLTRVASTVCKYSSDISQENNCKLIHTLGFSEVSRLESFTLAIPGSFCTSRRLFQLGPNNRPLPGVKVYRSSANIISCSRLFSTTALTTYPVCLGFGKKGVRTDRLAPATRGAVVSTMGQNSSSNSYSVNKGDNPNDRQAKSTSVEAVVCSTNDLQNGQMKEVEVGGQKVLLVKDSDQFYALGNKCTHYGAPLSKGSYCNGLVRCPWHGACFNVKTGDIEDFPGLDSVHTFQVEVRGTDVLVKADPAALNNFRRVKTMSKSEQSDAREVVIIGGGPASVVCAETLRQEGFIGKITLVSMETNLPYDRIKLSKTLSAKAEEIALRKEDFYKDIDTRVLLGKEVTEVDTVGKQVVMSDGVKLPYTTLVVATGGRPRKPDILGVELANVFTLRTVKDANTIAAKFKDKHVVVLGTSFIGLEVACAMVSNAASVSVVGNSAVPLLHVFGREVGEWIQKLHESKGVKFYNSNSISEFEGQDGVLTGVSPATDFLKGSGLNLTDRGYVSVDKNMRTNIKDVYAAGDITVFPLASVSDESVNIQHWQMAHQHGRIAGLDIAGKGREISSVPYFWTVQFGKSIRYAGYSYGYDDLILHGNLEENKFVAFYTKCDRVTAAASLGWDPIVSQFAQLLASGGSLSKQEARQDPSILAGKLSET